MSSRDLIFTSLTRRPSLVTGSHSLSSALPPRTPRPLTRPRPRPGPLPQTHCRSLRGSQRGLPLQGPRGLRALPQDWRHPPFGVLMKKKRSITFKNHESLYHTPVTYIILYINYTSIKNKMTTSPEKQYSLMLWEVFVIKCKLQTITIIAF